MPPKSLDAWLAKFVEDELNAVIEWKQQLQQGVKPDPESRFSDDGSNLRSEVRSPPATTTVQLIEVLTSEDVATAYVSDGIIKVKVRLSADAIVTFEEDSDVRFSPGVKGDVFRLVRFTVVSTPFGPADGFVQLHVDEIEYEAMRRGLYDGMPIERDYGIRTLIESTKLLRVPENAATGVQSRPRPAATQLQTTAAQLQPAAAQLQTTATVGSSSSTAARAPAIRTQHSTPTRAASEIRPISPKEHMKPSRAQNKRKLPGPTLSDDGYELESGVNLHGPVVPNNRDAGTTSASKQAVNTHLLGLLGGTKAPASKTLTHTNKATSDPQTQGPLQTQHRTTPAVATTPVVHAATTPVAPAGPVERAEQTIPESSPIHASAPTPGAHLSPPSHADDDNTPASQLDTESVPRGRTLFAYARRKVPAAQRKLLDNPASWLPSLPGRQFPKPNVPMELLSKWNAEAAAAPRDPILSQHSHMSSQHEYAPLSEVLDDSDSDSDSDSDHSDDGTEYPPSPEKNWLPRQAAIPPSTTASGSVSSRDSFGGASRPASVSPRAHDRPDMPPSSILGSVIRGTPLDGELEVAVPRPLPARLVPEKRTAYGDILPPAKRQSLWDPPASNDARVTFRHLQPPGQLTYPLPSPVRASQQSSPAGTGRNLPSQVVAPAGHPDSQLHATPKSANLRSQAPAATHQYTPTSSSRGAFPTTQQHTAPSTPTQQAANNAQTPSNHSTNGRLSQQPPSGPRSIQPHTYRATQHGQRASGGSTRQNTLPELNGSQKHLAGTPMHKQVDSSQARHTRVMDVTDPSFEVVSSSISPQQDPARAGERPLSTPRPVQSHVIRSPFDQSEATKPTLSVRKAWLKANYVATNRGKEDLPAVLEQYRKSFPADQDICLDDMLEAARYAFDGIRVTPDTRYMAKTTALESRKALHQRSSDAQQPTPGTSSKRCEGQEKHSLVAAEASPSAYEHPGLLHRQKRTDFMNKERRKAWLQNSYVPSNTGTVPLATVLEHYRRACPEDDQVQLDTLLTAAQSVPTGWCIGSLKISAETQYRRRSETVGTAKHPMTNDNVNEQARSRWIKANYVPCRKGDFELATVMARYMHSCPHDDTVDIEDFLRAGQAAWPSNSVTPGMRWTVQTLAKSVAHDIVTWLQRRYRWDPAGSLRHHNLWIAYQVQKPHNHSLNQQQFWKALTRAFPTKKQDKGMWRFTALHDEAAKSTSAHQTTDASTQSSAVIAESPARRSPERNRKNDHELLDIDNNAPIRSMAEVCAAYLKIQHGNHNAFGAPIPRRRQKWNVDVLQWDI